MMTQKEIYAAVARFCDDKGRIISERNLCDLAGISQEYFKLIFKYKERPMSVMVQLRMAKALEAIERGEIKVVRNLNNTVTAGYRKKAQPEFSRGYGLTMKNGRIAVKCGPVNVNSYTQPTFKEELER